MLNRKLQRGESAVRAVPENAARKLSSAEETARANLERIAAAESAASPTADPAAGFTGVVARAFRK
jgi:hypothetical protein